jgi:RNA polymerase-binding transcription factor DksA
MKSDTERKQQMETRLNDLTARMKNIDAELDSHSSKDWEELATEREGDEVLEDLGAAAQNELRMIGAALARVDDGSYGFCVRCGDRIAEERIDLIPATPFCQSCAQDH